LNKQELVIRVAAKAETTKAVADRVSDAVFDAISEALSQSEKVALVGFGTFEVRDRAARTGRNPQTGEEIQIAATRVPAFTASKALKAAVAG
jgi:DNA-binding protein HU-beta